MYKNTAVACIKLYTLSHTLSLQSGRSIKYIICTLRWKILRMMEVLLFCYGCWARCWMIHTHAHTIWRRRAAAAARTRAGGRSGYLFENTHTCAQTTCMHTHTHPSTLRYVYICFETHVHPSEPLAWQRTLVACHVWCDVCDVCECVWEYIRLSTFENTFNVHKCNATNLRS